MDNDVVISVENVTMAFNLNKEKVDNLKEYVIKLLRRQLEPAGVFHGIHFNSLAICGRPWRTTCPFCAWRMAAPVMPHMATQIPPRPATACNSCLTAPDP